MADYRARDLLRLRPQAQPGGGDRGEPTPEEAGRAVAGNSGLLTAAERHGDDAYGARMREEIESATGRGCSLGALYTTLDRLESKGLLKTWMGEATPQRGGRAKRKLRVTAEGVPEARALYNAVTNVSLGVSWVRP